uniref:uncharacterized protein LOC113474437 n=1 Tax=Ciona intestinalis TaxID=7719 RepID=UPI000EF49CB4|nr:uncharacterized protein LOC113474437 [Ciona intestinalis]|eukprot:XP_026691288.1 uncharacterized protein LOC113474437 [Ciona intestinalis]
MFSFNLKKDPEPDREPPFEHHGLARKLYHQKSQSFSYQSNTEPVFFSTPVAINLTAKLENQSLPHKFKVTVVEILEPLFIVSIKRTDKNEGWSEITFRFYWELNLGYSWGAYKGLYFHLPYTSGGTEFNREKSHLECSKSGGKLADIVDKEMYDFVNTFVEVTFDSGRLNFVIIWTAMNYNQANSNVTRSNGKPGYNGDWNPGYPTTSGSRTGVVVFVGTNPSAGTNIGMRNAEISQRYVPLCVY